MTDQSTQPHQGLDSFDERIEILANELDLAIQWQRPCLLLVVYSSEYVRADAEIALENYLIDLGQKTAHLSLKNAEFKDTADFLRRFKDEAKTVFFIDGLRWGHNREASIYTALNLQREFFIEKRVRVIFWLTQNEVVDLAYHAPDFWAYRHRVIEFIESPRAERVLQQALEFAWQGIGEYADQFEDTDAKISLRESLLTDLPKGNEVSSIRANLLLTLGVLNWRKGDFAKADEQLREALKIATKIEDNWFEAECFNAIALVKTSMERSDEAIDAYKQAIRLAPDQIFAWNNLGNLCAKIGRNDEAMVAFLKAIECNPRDPIGWNGLGNVYTKVGYVDDAIAAYRKSIQHMPTFAQPWNGLGDVYANMGRIDEAIKAYHKAIELNKHYVTPWLRLGILFAKQERFRDAIKAYQRALDLDPKNSVIWNEMGMIYLQCEAYEEAVEAFSKAIELDRGYGWAYSNLGLTHAEQGKYQESIPLYLRSLELLKDDKRKAVAWDRLGNAYRQINDYDRAIEAYQMADMLDLKGPTPSSGNPSDETGSNVPPKETDRDNQANVDEQAEAQQTMESSPSLDQGKLSVNETMDQKSLETPYWIFNPTLESEAEPFATPDTKEPMQEETADMAGTGRVLQGTEGATMKKPISVNAAQMMPEASLQGKDNDSNDRTEINAKSSGAYAWNEKGNMHYKQGEFEDAINAYNKAIQLDPTLGWAYSNLALTYLTLGQFAEAILKKKKSVGFLNTNEEKAISWNGLGNVYRCINDYANAVAAYQKAAELDPQTAGMRDGAEDFQGGGQTPRSAQAWNDLGEVFFKTGAYDEALNAFNKAIELDPESGWAYSNLARTLASQGKYTQAIPLYQKSIDLLREDKDKAVVWNRLGNVYRKLNDYEHAVQAFHKADELDAENAGFRDELDEVADAPSLVEGSNAENGDRPAEVAVSPIQLIVAESQAEEAATNNVPATDPAAPASAPQESEAAQEPEVVAVKTNQDSAPNAVAETVPEETPDRKST